VMHGLLVDQHSLTVKKKKENNSHGR
jgi:hypothetical protein